MESFYQKYGTFSGNNFRFPDIYKKVAESLSTLHNRQQQKSEQNRFPRNMAVQKAKSGFYYSK